jgi:NADH:ubiquinone oxidoreductase subunit 3 (subunit A)
MVIELVLAFSAILGLLLLLCIFGNRLAPKAADRDQARIQYACGEEPIAVGRSVNLSLYKYLVYFLVADSSLLIIAFSVLGELTANLPMILLYLGLLLAASYLFLEGSGP